MKNKIWLDQLRAEDRDTVFSLTSDPEIVKYMRFGTHERCRRRRKNSSRELYGKGKLRLFDTADGQWGTDRSSRHETR